MFDGVCEIGFVFSDVVKWFIVCVVLVREVDEVLLDMFD